MFDRIREGERLRTTSVLIDSQKLNEENLVSKYRSQSIHSDVSC